MEKCRFAFIGVHSRLKNFRGVVPLHLNPARFFGPALASTGAVWRYLALFGPKIFFAVRQAETCHARPMHLIAFVLLLMLMLPARADSPGIHTDRKSPKILPLP